MTASFSHTTDLSLSPSDQSPAPLSDGLYRRVGKRLFDIFLVLVTAGIWIPLIAILAGLVMLDGANPFFLQDRVGRGGRIFRMIKLRSMVHGAEEKLDDHLRLNPDAAEEWRVRQKLSNDPRVTPVGHFLRRTSLDELPQLFNVLRGDMALVGPRPMLETQRVLYPGMAYYRLRPGLTGAWQVFCRNESGFASRSRYDSYYARKMSLRVDLSILMRTVVVVLRCTGV